MQCPDCGGPMWDNRDNKRNPKQPDFKCKDKDGCGKGVWLDKKKSGGRCGNGHGAAGGSTAAGPRSTRPLAPLYYHSMKVAKATLDELVGKDKYSVTDLVAATATLFISTRDGAPLLAPKPKPAPPPPPVEDDSGDDADYDDGDARSLPF